MTPRFHHPLPLVPGAIAELSAEAAHHATRVLRLGEGAELCLFDGRGGEWSAHIVRLKPTVAVRLARFDPDSRASPVAVILAQCLPSADKMDWVVQKAVELGVAAIQPVAAKRSVLRLSEERMEKRLRHWRGVAVAACEQCGANVVPDVAPILDLPQYLGQARQENESRLLLLPGAERRLRELSPPAGPVTLLVGPEGGFEDGEIAAAKSAGFVPIGLGPRVLRTETAGPSALAAIMSLWGDW